MRRKQPFCLPVPFFWDQCLGPTIPYLQVAEYIGPLFRFLLRDVFLGPPIRRKDVRHIFHTCSLRDIFTDQGQGTISHFLLAWVC